MNYDLRSDLLPTLALKAAISTNTTTYGAIIDTSSLEAISFDFWAESWTDGAYAPVFRMSDDSSMSGAIAVPSDNIIGSQANAVVGAALAQGGQTESLGLFGTMQYVQFGFTSTGVTTGAALRAIATAKPQILPAVNPED